MNCTNAPFGMDSLIGSLLERTLSTQTFRLRQDEVKARLNKLGERLELLIAATGTGAWVDVAGTAYDPAADWEAIGVPLE